MLLYGPCLVWAQFKMAIAEFSSGPEKNVKRAKLHKKHKIRAVSFPTVACRSGHYSSVWGWGRKTQVLNRQLEVELVACQVTHLGGLFQSSPLL